MEVNIETFVIKGKLVISPLSHVKIISTLQLVTSRLNKTRLNSILILLVYFSYQNNDISRSPGRHISIIRDIIITIGISGIS